MGKVHRGFSLVELLIVIGIIAVLMGILLPALAGARKMARSTACLANLQQWGDSFHMYLNANAGHSFVERQELTGLAWYEVLQPYNGDVHRTLLCPDATEPGNLMGSASLAWGPEVAYDVAAPLWKSRGVFVGSYGFNTWLCPAPPAKRGAADSPYARSAVDLPTRQPADVPVLADCIQSWAAPQDTDDVPRDLQHPIPFYSGSGPKPWGPGGMLSYYCLDRHARAVNVVFVDGHATRVPLAELWRLRWNNDFTPRDVIVPK